MTTMKLERMGDEGAGDSAPRLGMERRSPRARAFTLIELLVVIAIIGIVAAMLFPVFARAKEAGKKATCVSNQRQIGMALSLYVGDAEDTFPAIRFTSGALPYNWRNAVQSYAKSTRIFACPSNPEGGRSDAEGFESEASHVLYRSYGFSSCVASYRSMDGEMGPSSPPLVASLVSEPARTIELAEQTGPSAFAPDFWPATLMQDEGQCGRAFEHTAGRANFLRFDGHVSSMTWGRSFSPISSNAWELNVSGPPQTPPSMCWEVPSSTFNAAGRLCPEIRA